MLVASTFSKKRWHSFQTLLGNPKSSISVLLTRLFVQVSGGTGLGKKTMTDAPTDVAGSFECESGRGVALGSVAGSVK